jgi:simple sugar transport system substrate-binding protein
MSRPTKRKLALVGALTGITAAVAATALGPSTGRSAAVAPQAAGKWCAGVHLRSFLGGSPGDTAATIVFNGAKAAQASLGPKVDYVFSGWSSEKMVSQLRDAIAAGVDGVAMVGLPGDAALMPLAKQAAAKHVAIEYLNIDPPGTRAKYGGGYVGANLGQQGLALGTKALALFPSLKKGDRVLDLGAFSQPKERFVREDNVARAFEHAGLKVDRVAVTPEAASNPNLLTPAITAAFLRHPDYKVVVYGGGQLLGAAPQYMQAVHKKPGEVFNIGFDLSPQVIDAFKTGYVQLTSDQQLFLQGYLPILSLCLTAKYGIAPLNEDTGAGFVTSQNYKAVAPLVAKGIR